MFGGMKGQKTINGKRSSMRIRVCKAKTRSFCCVMTTRDGRCRCRCEKVSGVEEKESGNLRTPAR